MQTENIKSVNLNRYFYFYKDYQSTVLKGMDIFDISPTPIYSIEVLGVYPKSWLSQNIQKLQPLLFYK